MVGIHTIMDLKHPQALSLQSICLRTCVFYTNPPTCFNLRRPETEEAMQRIRNQHSQIPDTGFFCQSHSRQSPSLLVSRAGESWNNTSQGDA